MQRAKRAAHCFPSLAPSHLTTISTLINITECCDHTGAAAVTTLIIFTIFAFMVRASFRRNHTTAFPPVAVQRESNDPGSGTTLNNIGDGAANLDRPSKQTPTRIPVVIVEPDSTVELAYALRHDPETGEVPLTTKCPTRGPLLRAPTVPSRTSLDEAIAAIIQNERSNNNFRTGSKEILPPADVEGNGS